MRRPPRPTLSPYTTLFRSQLLSRQVLGQVKHVETPADDLAPGVAGDALSAEIPGQDVAFGVEGEDAAIDVFYLDRKSTRLNSSHMSISYAVFCLKKKI